MKPFQLAFAAACLALLSAPSPSIADGLKFPNLNPFKREDAAPRTARTSRSAETRQASSAGFPSLPTPPLPQWEMPKFSMPTVAMPTLGGAGNGRTSRSPSTWQKMSRGTRTFLTRTKTTLMPWAKKEPSTVSTPQLGARRSAQRNSKPKADDNSLLPWLGSKPEQQEIKSVNDFLALPQPSY